MRWTMTRKVVVMPIGMAVVALFGTGCGPDANKKIAELTSENEMLKRENSDLSRQLNDAQVRDNDAQKTIDELNRELAKMGTKPKEVDGWASAPGFDMISIEGSVLFESGRTDLKPSGRSTLSKIASDIRSRFPGRDIYIFGHTDSEPIRKSKWKDNWQLASERSLAVVREMRSLGIPQEKLMAVSCGEQRPRGSNSSPSGRQQNRRVEFYAVDKAAARASATIDFDN